MSFYLVVVAVVVVVVGVVIGIALKVGQHTSGRFLVNPQTDFL